MTYELLMINLVTSTTSSVCINQIQANKCLSLIWKERVRIPKQATGKDYQGHNFNNFSGGCLKLCPAKFYLTFASNSSW